MQRKLGVEQDGEIGPITTRALQRKVGAEVTAPTITSWATSDARLRFLTLDGVHILRASALKPDGATQELIRSQQGKVVDLSVTALTLIVEAFSVMLFTFYLVADGPKLRRAICSRLRPSRQRQVLAGWELAIDKTGGYLYSRALLAGLSTTAAPAADAPSAADAKPFEYATLQRAVNERVAKLGKDKLLAIAKAHGAATFKELPAAKWQAVYNDVVALGV